MIQLYIWLVCCVVAYPVLRYGLMHNFSVMTWTRSDRTLCLISSLGGPFTIIAGLILWLRFKILMNGDKPAEW